MTAIVHHSQERNNTPRSKAAGRVIRRAAPVAVAVILLAVAAWPAGAWIHRGAALASGYVSDLSGTGGARGWLTSVYDEVRGRLYFRRVARELVRTARTDRERVDRLLEWTYLQVRPASWGAPLRVQFDDPYRTVKRGFGYCDQSAHVFGVLAREAGLNARVYYLRNAEGESPHTVAQVLLDGEWIFVDTLYGRVLEAGGTPLTRDALAKDPALLMSAYEDIGFQLPFSADDILRGYLPWGEGVPWRP